MWSSNRRGFLALGAGCLLSACNFTPAYGPGGAGAQLLDRVFIPEPKTEDLYQIVKHFEQRMGRASEEQADLKLAVTVSKSLGSSGWTATGGSTRSQWTGTLTYTLSNKATGQTLQKDSIKRFTGYASTVNTTAALASERDAARRLMVILTDAMIDQLLQIDPTDLP